MQKNILTPDEAIKESNLLKIQGKKIGLAGGCFDILHGGHVEFLKKAKEKVDVLFVLLESDEAIKMLKGNNRPINDQQTRATILSAIRYVDYVVTLVQICTNDQYDDIIQKLNPVLIATTQGDKNIEHKKRQAKLTGADLIEVMPRKLDQSTSKIAQLLSEEI